MEEVHYDPSNIQHISSSTNPGTSSVVNRPFWMLLLEKIFLLMVMILIF